MSAGTRSTLSAHGQYGAVGYRRGETVPLGQVKQVDETTRRRELVDPEQLSGEFREAIDAEHFLIYGKASVEQFDEDDPPQKLTMDALADALPQLYQDGILSRRHKDVPVGEVVSEHTLDEPTGVQVGDETLRFDAGDTLETHIDESGEEFWIVADIWNRSEIAKDTRLRALTGDLDGFSVTIYAIEWDETPTGQEVAEIDWHAVTIGRDDQIKNKDSRFGVAEFKALFGTDDTGAVTIDADVRHAATRTMEDTFNSQLFTKAGTDIGFDESRLQAATAFAQKADSDMDTEELAEQAKAAAEEHDTDPKAVVELANHLQGEKADMGEDVMQILDQVEADMGEDARNALEGAIGAQSGGDDGGSDGGGDDAADDVQEAQEGEMKGDNPDDNPDDEDDEDDADTKSAPENAITEGDLDEKLDDRLEEVREDMKSNMDDMESRLGETMKAAIGDVATDIAEDTAEKMATGSTDDPAQGSTQDRVDYGEQIAANFGSEGGKA